MLTNSERELEKRELAGEHLSTDEKLALRAVQDREANALRLIEDEKPMTRQQGRTIIRILTFWCVLTVIGLVVGFIILVR
jgi:hypothetical protein